MNEIIAILSTLGPILTPRIFNPAILIMIKNPSDLRLWGSNDSAFRLIRPHFQHEIEQICSLIKAKIGRKRLYIIEQTLARRKFLTRHAVGSFLKSNSVCNSAYLPVTCGVLCVPSPDLNSRLPEW